MISALDLDENPPLDSLADESSIKLLLTRTGKTLTELLTGQNSLGKYIEDGIVNGVTLEAVPSDMNPDANGHTYFAAKDSPITNGHRDNINVLQIEMPSSGRKDYQSDYSNALGEAFLKFYGRYIGKYSAIFEKMLFRYIIIQLYNKTMA